MVEAKPSIHHKRDLYSDVTARIVAELERGAAPWVKPWSATPSQNIPCNASVTNRPYSGSTSFCFGWLAIVAGQRHGLSRSSRRSEAGGNVRKGEHGTKVYFLKQFRLNDKEGNDGDEKLIAR